MLAYKGEVSFTPNIQGGQGGVMSMIGRRVANEATPLMTVEGSGTVLFGHGGHHVQVINLTGDTLYVEADRLLAFEGTLQQGTMFMGSQGGVMGMVRGQVTGQGLFTTTLKGHGSVAVMAHGGVIEVPDHPAAPGPCRPAGVRRPPRRRPQQAVHGARLARHGGPRLRRGVPAGAQRQRRGVRPGVGGEAVSTTRARAPPSTTRMTLPSDDNVNKYTFCVELKGSQWFLQKGKMIAYYGQIDFNGIGHGRLDRLVRTSFHSPLHASDWVVAEGSGKMLLADRAFDVNSYDLENGNLTIRSGNLLAFQPSLALKQSIVPGFLTLIGTGKFVAASNGPVVFMEPPIRVDPQALVGWADCPSPCHHYDHGYMTGVMGGLRAMTGLGGASGEEHQFEFVGAGTVLLQSTETLMAEQADGRGAAAGRSTGRSRGTTGTGQQPGVPRLPGQLGDLQRRFGL